MRVAEAAVAAAREAGAVPDLDEIGNEGGLIVRVDLRSRRHRDQLVRAPRPERFLPMPVRPFWALKCCW